MWVFGDLRRQLLGPSSHAQLLGSLSARSSEINRLFELHQKSIKKKSSVSDLRAQRHKFLQSVFMNLDSLRTSNPNFINSKGFSFENEAYSDSVLLVELPWTNDAWEALRRCGFEEESRVIELDSFSWGEILEEGGWTTLFEIFHNQKDWAPFAYANDLLIPQTPDLYVFAEFLERMLKARANMAIFDKPEWSDFLSRKYGWGRSAVSLSELGLENSVTRERARQIDKQFSDHFVEANLRCPKALYDFERLSELASNQFDDDSDAIDDSTSHLWDEDAIASMIGLFMGQESKAVFLQLLTNKKLLVAENLKKARKISKFRSKLGTLRLSQLRPFMEQEGILESELENAILSVYPNSVFAGDFVVAISKSREPLLFNALSRQLSVNQPLHYEVLYKGLEQAATFRKATLDLPGLEVFKEIIFKSSNFYIDELGYVEYVGDSQPIVDSSIRGWLVDYLREIPGNVCHKATLLRDAARDGYKFTSVSLYLSYSPEFRLIVSGESIHALVGASPSNLEISNAKALASINRVVGSESKVFVESNGTVKASFVFGTDFMVSGVISVSSTLSKLLGHEARGVECCELLISESKPRISSNTFLSNMAAIRDHLWFDHGLREGDNFSLLASKETLFVSAT